MSDNTRVINPNSFPNGAGDTIATDDIGGVKYQRVKLIHGADGVNDGDVSEANPFPVTGTVSTTNAAVSTVNHTSTPLNNGQTWTGTAEDVSIYPSVVVALKTDTAATLYVEFSPDGTNWDSSIEMAVAAGVNEVHRYTVTRKYFRARISNASGSNQTYLRFQTLLGNQGTLTSRLNSSIQTDSDSLITRSVLMGQTDNGEFRLAPVTPEGHLEVAIHGPRLPFGSIHAESLTPIFQSDAVYGVNPQQVIASSSLSGSATAADSLFTVSSGTTIYAQAALQSRKRLRYRAGQGVVGRFAGKFTTGVADSYQVAGFGHAEDGVYFGYVGTDFGILYSRRGVREVQTLTVSAGASSAANATVTLNGVAYTVALTNANNIYRAAWEIAQVTYAGWKAEANGATVVFVADSAGNKAGAFTYGAGTTGSAASFAETKAGVAATETFYPQTDWNGDKMDGTGPSGVIADWTKGNVFQINIQYLGFGSIVFMVETDPDNSNNPDFVVVHALRLPNTLSTTSFGNPSFPFTMAVYSAGSTTNLTISIGSFAGFIEGPKMLHGNRMTYTNSLTTVGAVNLQALFTILNTRYYASRTNQSVINLRSVSGALKHTSPCIFYLIKNGALAGAPNFTNFSTSSASKYDTAATTVTFTDNDQVLWTGHLGDTGEIDHHFVNGALEDLTLQPGEWVTLAARAVTGSPSYVTGSINTREDT